MAITKTDATVEGMTVLGDGSVKAIVNYALSDDSTSPATIVTRARTTLTVSNATDAEKTAAASLVSKAQALAVG
jgi:hypothetical protein